MYSTKLFIFQVFIEMIYMCFGLDNPGYVTEKGREFIIAFVENRVLVDFPIIKLYATSVSDVPVNVTFSVPLMKRDFPDETLELQPGEVAVKQYPYELHMLYDGHDRKGNSSLCTYSFNSTVFDEKRSGNTLIF